MNKQIEEMAKIPESEMGMSGYSKLSWELWGKGLCTMAEAEKADQIMRNMGYRKASEIFAEIEKLLKNQEAVTKNARLKEVADWIFHDYLPRKLAELKKKYESEDTE